MSKTIQNKKNNKKTIEKIPLRYLPKSLSKKDKLKYIRELNKSKKQYPKQSYYTRKTLKSFISKKSNHIKDAQRIYGLQKIFPNTELAQKTGCSFNSLTKIVKKGEGAYFSSGSRPNQTGQSWGLARLASAITAGKAAAVDYDILEKGCKPGSKALRLAKTAKRKYGFGHGKTRKVTI
jgi:DNA-binding Xre family transcriptional regulator